MTQNTPTLSRLEARLTAHLMGAGKPAANGGGTPKGPKYQRLCEGFVAAIEDGLLATGDRLPSEVDLAARLPVSLGTVQKALNTLAQKGLLVRRHGHGTFVGERPMAPDALLHYRFLAPDGETLLPVYTHVTSATETRQPGPWQEFLGVDACIVIERVIDINYRVSGLSRLYLPVDPFSRLLDMPRRELEGTNIRDFLKTTFGVATTRVSEQVACRPLPADITSALHLARDQPGLVYAMLGFGPADGRVSYQVAYFPPTDLILAIGEKVLPGDG